MIDLLKLICLDDGHGPIHVYLPLPTISNPQSHTKLFLFPFSFLFIYFSIKKKFAYFTRNINYSLSPCVCVVYWWVNGFRHY